MSKTPVLTTESLRNADLASRIFSFTVSCKVSQPYAYLASICIRETFNQLQRTNTPPVGFMRTVAPYRGTENAGETVLYWYYLFN